MAYFYPKYCAFGAALGFMFPVFALYLDMYILRPGEPSVFAVIQSNPLHYIIMLAPVVLAAVFYLIGRTRAALGALAVELERRNEAEKLLSIQAFQDALTGLGNRLALMQDLTKALNSDGRDSTLFLIDLDKFKFINDTLGHHVGDELLMAFAARLKSRCSLKCRIYRLGGDEFVILHDGTGTPGMQQAFGRQLAKFLAVPFVLKTNTVMIEASIGATHVLKQDKAPADALRRADLALYEAKTQIGTFVHFYDEPLAATYENRMKLEEDLRKALAQNQFELAFQPIICASNLKLRGFEALLRWNHPERGLIMPSEFIPIAEVSGLIVPIGKWVLTKACEMAARLPEPLSIAVNISAVQFKEREFTDFVLTCLQDSGLAPERLTLEITESLVLTDIESVSHTLKTLSARGVKIALDDFGTGFSSINHLRNLPLTEIKIDHSFAARMQNDPREAELVRTVIKLGQAFQISTTLEGVETGEQRDFAISAGITDLQGYLFAKPLSEADLPALLLRYLPASAGYQAHPKSAAA